MFSETAPTALRDAAPDTLPGATFLRDPVCSMIVTPGPDTPTAEHAGRRFYFCCDGCRTRFEADPAAFIEARDPIDGAPVDRATAEHVARHAGQRFFLSSAENLARFEAAPDEFAPPPAAAGLRHICPMCPEVESQGPDDCPICGMALEPAVPTRETVPSPELLDFQRRLWVAAPLALAVFVLEMGSHLGLPWQMWLGQTAFLWLQAALAAPVILWAGAPAFRRAATSILRNSPNMWTLIGLGTGAATLFSVVGLVAPGLFPASLTTATGYPPVYFEAAAVILALVLIGQVLEIQARTRTGDAVRALLDLTPTTARRIEADTERDVAVETVQIGNRLRIRPGERLPVDARILEGRSSVDESALTGEPIPVERGPGDLLSAGTLNGAGALVIEAERVGQGTTLARIVALVAEAQRSRAPVQALADRVAGVFVPVVVAVAVVAFGLWLALGPAPALPYAVVAAVSVLIIACPCTLGLATPMSITVALGRGAQAGVLVRDAAALERLAEANVLVLDKTGTLTEGRPVLREIVLTEGAGLDETRLLALAAGIERASEHPLAAAILAAAEARGVAPGEGRAVEAVPGQGIAGEVVLGEQTHRVVLGNAAMLGGVPEALATHAARLQAEGATTVYLAVDGHTAGLIALADPLRPGARETLEALEKTGLRLILATGDAEPTAQAVAAQAGLTEIHAALSPEGKAALVARLQAEGATVAMAGDGINDAPALATADVGLAIGSGADVAVESAAITLTGDLGALVRARRLAKAARANIRQNLAFAFLYNTAGVPVAAGVLYPLFGVLLSPMLAAAAMSLSSLSVIANALRLSRLKL